MRMARIKLQGHGFHHCTSRIVAREFLLKPQHREYFAKLLRKAARKGRDTHRNSLDVYRALAMGDPDEEVGGQRSEVRRDAPLPHLISDI